MSLKLPPIGLSGEGLTTHQPLYSLALTLSVQYGFLFRRIADTTSEAQIPPTFAGMEMQQKETRKAEYENALYYGEDCVVLLWKRDHNVGITASASSMEKRDDLVSEFFKAFPKLEIKEDKVAVKFWARTNSGPQSYTRRIEAQHWEKIKDNYTPTAAEGIQSLFNLKELSAGQLILWRGPAGTGKTHAIRSLFQQWKDKANFHYITDADAFFGEAIYMLNVLFNDGYDDDDDDIPNLADILNDLSGASKMNLLVFEDAGEMIVADAKNATGQGLSRLLNVVDGMIGQGLKLMLLITTNEELGKLHPAVSRSGRCVSNVEFESLPVEQANAWLKAKECKEVVAAPTSLADLYAKARADGEKEFTSQSGDNSFGFARVSKKKPRVLAGPVP